MKNITKILLLVLMIAAVFMLAALPAFASEDVDNNASVSEGEGNVGAENEGDGNEGGEAAVGGIGINVDFARFTGSLQYMWKGMLCIFIVIGVIIAVTWGLNKAVNYAVEAKEARNSEEE